MTDRKVEVSLRVRPAPSPAASTVAVGTSGVSVGGSAPLSYAAQIVCGSDQQASFDALAAPLLARLRDGYSCTLLAYGQTGSGKTHTMSGPPGSLTEASLDGGASAYGVLPRVAITLLNSLPAGSTLHASAIEVYQELAYDLLRERAPLTVGTKGSGQLAQAEGAAASSSTKAAVGKAHPAGCRCRLCVAEKDRKAEELKRRMAERRGEQYFTGSGSDPFKMKKEAEKREREAKRAAAKPKGDEKDDFATVGEALAPLASEGDVMRRRPSAGSGSTCWRRPSPPAPRSASA